MFIFLLVVAFVGATCPRHPPASKCRANEILADCGFQCPNVYTYCPRDDSREIILCKAPRDCPPGCLCKDGYRRKEWNNATSTCVRAKDCPPVECTRAHEVWNRCTRGLDESCSAANDPPATCNEPSNSCQPQCVCKKGYFRDSSDNCIPKRKCPGESCGPNEKYYDVKPCPPQNCNKSSTITICDGLPDDLQREPGCDCIKNHLRHPNGTCIPKEKCPPQIDECPENEILVECKVPCPTDSCPTTDSRAVPQCSQPYPCLSGCVCKLGFRRKNRNDPSSACIPAEKCPPVECKRRHERWEPCPRCLDESCSAAYNPPATCNELVKNCQPQCVCKKGYFRDDHDRCIPRNQCPKPELECGPDEYYEPCSYPCPPQNCSSIWIRYACKQNQTCSPACRCKDGMRDDKTGVCKTTQECISKKCGPNEKFYDSLPCPPNNCDISYTTYICDSPSPEAGCDCIENYLRSPDGKCILNEDCPPPNPEPVCGPDEYYEPCSYPCPPQNCSSIRSRYACDQNQTCSPACRCKDGYYRDDKTGVCKTTQECLGTKCGLNEKLYDQIPCPPLNCDIPYTDYKCDDVQRMEGCDCEENYLRHPNGTCIWNDDCPPPPGKCYGSNEEWNSCASACLNESCASIFDKQATHIPCLLICVAKCVCKEGYLRNADNICIPARKCPNPELECGPDEYYEPCSYPCPPQNCSSIWSRYACDQNQTCSPACRCKDGYRDDKTGVCKTTQECLGTKCGLNEKFYDEIPCPPLNCDIPYTDYQCDDIQRMEGCDCEENYLRHPNGTCIWNDDCPPPPVLERPTNICTTTLKPIDSQIRTSTDNQGHSGSDNPVLEIPSDEYCTTTLKPTRGQIRPPPDIQEAPGECYGSNEEWNSCASACLNESCASIFDKPPTGRACILICVAKCVCKKGYLRNAENICIPARKCPPPTDCPANERAVPCKSDCPTDFCPTDDSRGVIACDPAHPCLPGCICDVGFRRRDIKNSTSSCIPAEECPPVPCTRAHETWNTCPRCLDESCAAAYNQPTTCNELIKNCQPRCVCAEGYYRDDEDNCVSLEECPKKCGVNETYALCDLKCPEGFCPKDDSGGPVCDAPKNCPPGCACKPNYLRRSYEDESCVLVSDCPPVKCSGSNEEWHPCTSACLNESCASIFDNQTTDKVCITLCVPKCVCKKGYLRNADNICIPARKCPPAKCLGPNEEWNSCASACRNESCDSRFKNQTAEICMALCVPKCVCKEGYWRNADNICVPAKKCPPVKCSGSNEEWNSCASACLNESCASVFDKQTTNKVCSRICVPKCVCKKGYLRNADKTCIPEKKCPPVKCPGPNEKWNSCASACRNESCDSRFINQTGEVCAALCEQKCVCKEGYWRNADNICVPAKKCPPVKCSGSNEEWNSCASACLNETCASFFDKQTTNKVCSRICVPKCVCKKGYLRNADKTCIPEKKCPPVKCPGPNEKWNSCASACRNESCDSRFINQTGEVCAALCEQKCVCREGYWRNADNICVPAKKCPPVKCPGPNEEWNSCASACRNESCDSRFKNQTGVCMALCVPKCVCKEGYWRNADNICVPAKKCPPIKCSGPNEKWNSCASPCKNESCDNVCNEQAASDSCIERCEPKCVCNAGYWRNAHNICIPAEKCPLKKKGCRKVKPEKPCNHAQAESNEGNDEE